MISVTTNNEPPFTCPFCEKELYLPVEDIHYYTCDHCGKKLDLLAQFAFLRGTDAFKEAQYAFHALRYRKLKYPSYDQAELEVVRVFMEAYFAIQQAFTTDLADHQRTQGVEMMVHIAQLFVKRDMISILEVNYWNSLMVEHTAQEEFDEIGRKLASPLGVLGFLMRLRWHSRRRQLKRALKNLDKKIKTIEANMAFVYPLHTRKSHWKPTD